MATNATVQPIKTNTAELHAESFSASPETHSAELCHMTKAQLLDMAADLGIADIKSTMRKGEMIDLIEAAKGM